MKIKKINTKNSYKIVVDDENINKLYGYSQKDPLVLAHLFSYNPNQWIIQDCRLFRKAIPAAKSYVQDTMCEYSADSQEQLQLMIALADLKIYKIIDNTVSWSTFAGIVVNDSINTQTPEPNWSFKEGQNKLKKLSEFWEQYSGTTIEIIDNKLLQLNKDALFMFNFLIKEFKNDNAIKSEEQLSKTIDNFKTEYWEGTSISIPANTLELLQEYLKKPVETNENHKRLKIK